MSVFKKTAFFLLETLDSVEEVRIIKEAVA
jgi:hypothetical protein